MVLINPITKQFTWKVHLPQKELGFHTFSLLTQLGVNLGVQTLT